MLIVHLDYILHSLRPLTSLRGDQQQCRRRRGYSIGCGDDGLPVPHPLSLWLVSLVRCGRRFLVFAFPVTKLRRDDVGDYSGDSQDAH